MKCHYEILGLPLTASSDEIKKAYRKLALEWHPDKNLHRIEESKEFFQLLQQAYEILSDPQERAWYDRHREEILHAGFAEHHKNDTLDVFQYYNTSCYKGFGDDSNGFYSVYQEVFSKIAAEDEPFMEEDSNMEIPMFGSSTSSYEEVVHNFYAYWQSYCTLKTFSWVDTHNLTEARKISAGRQVLRLMEKENKKLRDHHKKLRNEEVRQLVQFVRKRDKRVQAHKKLVEEQNAEKTKKFQEQRKKQLEERQKNLQNYKETEWTAMSQLEGHFNEIENNLDQMFGAAVTIEEGEDEAVEDLYCVACDKDFRSLKSKTNHENSRKHKENVLLLKHLMQEEENEDSDISADPIDELQECIEEPDDCDLKIELEDIGSSDDEVPEVVITKKQKKKKKNLLTAGNYGVEELDVEEQGVGVEEDILIGSNELPKDAKDTKVSKDVQETAQELPETSESCDLPKNLVKKRRVKVKDSKKNLKTEIIPDLNQEAPDKQSTSCERCLRNFNSRNKLFEHLKTSGHAVYLTEKAPQNSSKNAEKPSKSKKRR